MYQIIPFPSQLGYQIQSKRQRIQDKYFRKFIFVHINKTGGKSIMSALGIRERHCTALEQKNNLNLFKDWIWQRKFVFAFVRNPWERVVSQYAHRTRINQCNMKTNPIEFNKWLRLAYIEHHPDYYDEPKMFIPQMDWLVDEKGEIIVDYIGRFENLKAEFRYICDRIGIEAKLPHLNASPKNKPYQDYYNPQSIKLVGDLFKKDIDYFNYTF